jgi:hypothetical protein
MMLMLTSHKLRAMMRVMRVMILLRALKSLRAMKLLRVMKLLRATCDEVAESDLR